METKKNYFVVEEDTDMYNVLCMDDFDDEGYFVGHAGEDGYHLDDFDVVEEFDTFDEAWDWVEDLVEEKD